MINIKSISEKTNYIGKIEDIERAIEHFSLWCDEIAIRCLKGDNVTLGESGLAESSGIINSCIEAQRNGGWNYNLEEMPIDIDCLCLTDANKVCIAVKDDSFNIISRGLITDSRYSNTVVAWAKLPPVKE